ncbi:hypothetical protein CpipJ_CPIJ008470 [Culex quinquefasciatus]|uniref:Uncharacterized protein n=1 Tax=Culex quinquefasciatus TaxID=7176 RepID=B0WMY5_CULQU|nr:hypothetical protein CpipJ_CPIJ008470 [Culex quinquefasciatus]|eukprot:XP_001850069.1 hypothetical protein CpipJ_CPIJ008470 [Culex quinquefasciatus]
MKLAYYKLFVLSIFACSTIASANQSGKPSGFN